MEKPKLYWQRLWGCPSEVQNKNVNGHYMSNEHLEKVMGEWYDRGAKDGELKAFRDGVEEVGKRLREEEERYGWELDEHAPGFYIIYQLLKDMNALPERKATTDDRNP